MTSHLENNEPITLFRSHFERIQRRLEAEGKAAQSFHHGLNRGLIREAFIREFLSENISEFWGVGTGEIFHPEAQEEETRNQIDVVIHNKRYPKLPLSGGIDLFFIETVSSFIEIKSRLTKDDVKQAADAAKRIKSLASFEPQRFNPTGMVENPRPYAFIFAYEGPAKIETVLRWMIAVSEEDDYGLDQLRTTSPEDSSSLTTPSSTVSSSSGKGSSWLMSCHSRARLRGQYNKASTCHPVRFGFTVQPESWRCCGSPSVP